MAIIYCDFSGLTEALWAFAVAIFESILVLLSPLLLPFYWLAESALAIWEFIRDPCLLVLIGFACVIFALVSILSWIVRCLWSWWAARRAAGRVNVVRCSSPVVTCPTPCAPPCAPPEPAYCPPCPPCPPVIDDCPDEEQCADIQRGLVSKFINWGALMLNSECDTRAASNCRVVPSGDACGSRVQVCQVQSPLSPFAAPAYCPSHCQSARRYRCESRGAPPRKRCRSQTSRLETDRRQRHRSECRRGKDFDDPEDITGGEGWLSKLFGNQAKPPGGNPEPVPSTSRPEKAQPEKCSKPGCPCKCMRSARKSQTERSERFKN